MNSTINVLNVHNFDGPKKSSHTKTELWWNRLVYCLILEAQGTPFNSCRRLEGY